MDDNKKNEPIITREGIIKVLQEYIYDNCVDVNFLDIERIVHVYINKKDVELD